MLRDFGFSTLSTAARFLASGLLFIVLAALWSPEVFGRFAFHHIVALVAAMVVDYGLSLKTMRDTGSSPSAAGGILRAALKNQLWLVLPSLLILALAWFSGIVADGVLLSALWCVHLLAHLVNTGYGSLRGLGRFHDEAKVALIGNAAFFALPVGLLAVEPGPQSAAAGMLLARLLQACVAIAYLRAALPAFTSSLPAESGMRSLRAGLPYALESWTSVLFQNVDSLVVRLTLGEAALGIYQVGVRFVTLSFFAVQALGNVYVPLLAAASTTPGAFRRTARQCLLGLTMVGVAGLAGLALFGPWLVDRVYGAEYAALVPLMPLFGLVVLARCVGAAYGIALTALGLQAYRFYALAGAAAGFVPLGLFGAGAHGLTGVLTASAAAVVLLGLAYWWRLRAYLGPAGPGAARARV